VTAVLHGGQENPTIATASIPAGQVSADGATEGAGEEKK